MLLLMKRSYFISILLIYILEYMYIILINNSVLIYIEWLKHIIYLYQ